MRSLAAAHETEGWRRILAICLLRWHLCSLDAPTVAVVWAALLARVVNVPLRLTEGLVLALGTWIVYVLDRVLDGAADEPRPGEKEDPARERLAGPRPVQQPGRLKDRHYFHARHRSLLLRLCCAAGALLALLCCWLPLRLVAIYLALGLPVAAYSLWVHARAGWPVSQTLHRGNGIAKEAAVAILFTAAVAAPALAGVSRTGRAALWIPALLLAGLCWLNCSLISHAEAPVCGAARSRRLQRVRLKVVAVALLLAAAIMCGVDPGWRGEASLAAEPAAAAVLLSCLGLLGLLMSMGVEDQTLAEARRLRVLADVALLTPLLFLLPRWV